MKRFILTLFQTSHRDERY